MLKAMPRKVLYWLLATLAMLMLMGAPSVVPAAHADPVCAPSTNCEGG